ncbi:hypothetical protein QOT17_003959 [Balamuthia mandrillaris]
MEAGERPSVRSLFGCQNGRRHRARRKAWAKTCLWGAVVFAILYLTALSFGPWPMSRGHGDGGWSWPRLSWSELRRWNKELREQVKVLAPPVRDTHWKERVEEMLSSCKEELNNTADAFQQPPPFPKAVLGLDAAVYFLHIEKCGGSTVWEFVRRNMRPRSVNLRFREQTGGFRMGWNDAVSLAQQPGMLEQAQKLFASYNVIVGHYVFGIHEVTPQRPYFYCTLLRDPFDRLISQYNFWRKLYGDKHGKDLVDFMTNTTLRSARHKDNLQTRVLCGREAYQVPRGNLTYNHLHCAMRHLRDFFTVVGTVERYAETLQLLSAHFGWTKGLELADQPRNPTGVHVGQKSIQPEAVRRAAQPLIKYDEILYRYGECLMERQVRGMKARGL